MAHGDAREGKWRGNWRMELVASTLHTTSEHGVSSITTDDPHTSAASSRLNWSSPADLNGLVPFTERRNLFSARVPSHFKSSLPGLGSSSLLYGRYTSDCFCTPTYLAGWTVRGLNSVVTDIFRTRPNLSWDPPSLPYNGSWVSFQGLKRPGHGVDCCSRVNCIFLDCVWNVMAHAHKPDFVFRRNGRVHLNWRGR
jgi:hypothetical protein